MGLCTIKISGVCLEEDRWLDDAVWLTVKGTHSTETSCVGSAESVENGTVLINAQCFVANEVETGGHPLLRTLQLEDICGQRLHVAIGSGCFSWGIHGSCCGWPCTSCRHCRGLDRWSREAQDLITWQLDMKSLSIKHLAKARRCSCQW